MLRLWSRLPSRHSLTAKILLVAMVFALVPLIIYDRLGDADRDKSALLYKAAREHGRLIATYLAPLLRKGPESLPEINRALEPLSTDDLSIRVLYRPASAISRIGFYYVAAVPPPSKDYLNFEISRLASLGILSRLSRSCSDHEIEKLRPLPENGSQQHVTILTPLAMPGGCWVILTSHSGAGYLGASTGRAYWRTPEIQFAGLLYLGASVIILLVLLRIRRGLRVFRNTAVATGRSGNAESFARQNRHPELNEVALEFDRMVQRIGLLSFAVERSPIAVAIADRNWIIEYVNSAYERLSGRTSEQLLGTDLRRKELESFSELSWIEICEQVAEGRTWHGQVSRQRPDGRVLWADVSLYHLVASQGAEEHFVCVQEDVTEQRRILKNLIAEKDRAESLNQMKSNFVARMSHEFRTPLNAIMGFSELIADETFGKCDVPKYIEYAGNIRSSGLHLLSLIDDILDLSRLESGKENLRLEAVDLAVVLREAETLIANEASKEQITMSLYDIPDDCHVIADRRAIKQVLLNLLSNAVKYTPSGGEVLVTIAPDEDGRVALTIADNGPGIDAAELPKICEPYERAGTAYVRNKRGTGLGLPIVKRLVELQNGAFEIRSKVGVGTTVEVILSRAAG